jgi:hypothetical protein
MLGVYYELIGATAEKHLNPKRGFLRELVPGMRPKIMDGAYQWIPAPQRQGQIKPRMEALIVHHVRSEVLYLAEDCPNGFELPKRLPQSGTPEGKQPYGIIQFFGVRSNEPIRKYEQDVGMSRHCIRQANTIFPEIGGDQCDA